MKKIVSLALSFLLLASSQVDMLKINAYGNISRAVPNVTQQEEWLCAPASVAAALKYINSVYLSSYNPDINARSFQVSIGGYVGVGDANDNDTEYIGDDGMMESYLNSHQTYRPTPYVYTVKPVGNNYNGVSGFLSNIYTALSNNAPPIIHIKCNTNTIGYPTTGGHFMVVYSISGASSSPNSGNTVGVVDPNRKNEFPNSTPKTTYSGLVLYNATMAMPNGVYNVIS
ncbi:MAG: C39 family peptidase [Oscillospiraceae bacterium]|jgi:hypothetical protein|nr:C39 family peptidase [Oscillospiraceae bacterium]